VAYGDVPARADDDSGSRKWFAATPSELADYLQQRITQYDTAKPIEACPTCVAE
jgi:hypothetical protein